MRRTRGVYYAHYTGGTMSGGKSDDAQGNTGTSKTETPVEKDAVSGQGQSFFISREDFNQTVEKAIAEQAEKSKS